MNFTGVLCWIEKYFCEILFDKENIIKIELPSEQNANSQVPAKSACVIEGKSGKVLYEQNKDEKLAMASTTKIATLIVALENYEN